MSSSQVWEYFTKIRNSANNKAKCKKCGTEVNNSKGSTSALINHMRCVHKNTCKRTHDSDSNASTSTSSQHKTIVDFMKKITLVEIFDELATKIYFPSAGNSCSGLQITKRRKWYNGIYSC